MVLPIQFGEFGEEKKKVWGGDWTSALEMTNNELFKVCVQLTVAQRVEKNFVT